jgi:hypothetical protein
MSTLRRMSLWFGSLFVAVTLFSLLVPIAFFRGAPVLLIFRVTLLFAFPVSCLYLPLVVTFKDAEEWRIWIILFSGTLIGPVSLALWGLLLQLPGGDPRMIWQGDPLIGLGVTTAMIFALIVGFLTACVYVVGLKVLYTRP